MLFHQVYLQDYLSGLKYWTMLTQYSMECNPAILTETMNKTSSTELNQSSFFAFAFDVAIYL